MKSKVDKNSYIKKFEVDISYLTGQEIEILEKLIEAAQLIAKIYKIQNSNEFYPKNATRLEIEKAAQGNPDILSPYTVVERDSNGRLVAIPYHIKYKELLLPVVVKLTEAAEISIHDPEFRKALLIQAKALLNGSYDKAQINWMKIKPYILDIVIGPIERIEDSVFFTKRAYQAWVGVMNKNITHRLNILKEIIFSSQRQDFLSERVDFMEKAQLRADEIVIFSGMITKYNFTATTLPNDINLLEKYGSEAWIFIQSIRENFEKRQLQLFNSIFDPKFRHSFSKEILFRGYLLIVAMHEIARITVRYRFAADRLKELYPVFNELAIETVAVKMTGLLLLKDIISQKEMETVLVMFLTRIFDYYVEKIENKSGSEYYVLGNAILLNSLIQSGALQMTKDGISWPNFTKMFIATSNLADEIKKVLTEGHYLRTKRFLDKHSSLNVFKNFSKALEALHIR